MYACMNTVNQGNHMMCFRQSGMDTFGYLESTHSVTSKLSPLPFMSTLHVYFYFYVL